MYHFLFQRNMGSSMWLWDYNDDFFIFEEKTIMNLYSSSGYRGPLTNIAQRVMEIGKSGIFF